MISGTTEHKGFEYKYTIELSEEDLVKYYTKKLVLHWCQSKHPEIFSKAEECIKSLRSNKESGFLMDEKA